MAKVCLRLIQGKQQGLPVPVSNQLGIRSDNSSRCRNQCLATCRQRLLAKGDTSTCAQQSEAFAPQVHITSASGSRARVEATLIKSYSGCASIAARGRQQCFSATSAVNKGKQATMPITNLRVDACVGRVVAALSPRYLRRWLREVHRAATQFVSAEISAHVRSCQLDLSRSCCVAGPLGMLPGIIKPVSCSY